MTQNEPSTLKQRFGRAVRLRRRELELSQEALAERAELHRTYISDIERGEANLSLENIQRLVKALDSSIVDFFIQYRIDLDYDQPSQKS